MVWTIDMRSGATAAVDVARLHGMGRIRHLDVTDLWVQEQLNCKHAALHKVLGPNNPADLFTKYTNEAVLSKAMATMHFICMGGRSSVDPAGIRTTAATTDEKAQH